jgi:hypothetical protein
MIINTLLEDVVELINNLDCETQIMHIYFKRHSNSGGYWNEQKSLIYPHHKEETIKYLHNWVEDITEIRISTRENKPVSYFQPLIKTSLLKTVGQNDK